MAVQLKPLLIDGKRRDITRRVLSVGLAFVAVWLAWTTKKVNSDPLYSDRVQDVSSLKPTRKCLI